MKKIINDLFLPNEKIKTLCGRIPIVFILLILYAVTIQAYYMFGVLPAVIAAAVCIAVYFLLWLNRFYSSNSAVSIVISLLLTLFFCEKVKSFLHSAVEYDIHGVIETICISLLLFFGFTLIFGLFLYFGALEKVSLKGMGKMAVCGGTPLFILLIYLPCDSYVNNFTDFNFPLTAFFFILLIRFLLFLLPLAYLGAVLKEKPFNVIFNIFCGLILCVFAQYMFMNRNLGLAVGDAVDWSAHLDYGLVTLIVWIALLALPFILSALLKKTWKKYSFAVPSFMGAMQVLSLILLLVTTENNIFSYRNDLLDGREQYTVSSKKNIVTFVFDAADNSYFDKLLETRPEVFEGLEDFTLYTNTCSVFDYTLSSMTQMLTGEESCPMYDTDGWLEKAWSTEKAEDFYKRLHEADYTVNGYMRADVPLTLLDGKFDNSSSTLAPQDTDKSAITESLLKIARYRYMPYMLKRFFDIQGIDFKQFVGYAAEFNYTDSDYMDNLKLTASNSGKNYFILEHLNGPHPPCDDMLEETVSCLNIVKEYIKQLKEMDLYDNAFIIITSDHGRHTSYFAEEAVTPIFMVKESGSSHDKMEITNAPQYHSDFLATYLKAAGIYTEADRELYGKTVFDYAENEQRERTWYDHRSDETKPNPNNAACNVYYAYRYIGTDEDLKQVINNNDPYEIIVKE